MPNRSSAVRPVDGSQPRRSQQFEHLTLDGLRSYRQTLDEEEHRISYWRRIIQARIDLITVLASGGLPDTATLSNIFAAGQAAATRTSMHDVTPYADLPPLPDLSSLWTRDPDPADRRRTTALLRDLDRAERQLSAYRTALHRRLSDATAELIARYREDPTQCLSALPRPRLTSVPTA